jgi:hypothetical protein
VVTCEGVTAPTPDHTGTPCGPDLFLIARASGQIESQAAICGSGALLPVPLRAHLRLGVLLN